MIAALREQFPLAFFTLFLSFFLPWMMDWTYLSAPYFTCNTLAALFLVRGFTAEGSAIQATRYGVVWGVVLAATGLAFLNLLIRAGQLIVPPLTLSVLLLAFHAAACRLVATLALDLRFAHYARFTAIGIVVTTYLVLDRLVSDNAVLLAFATGAAICGGASYALLRWRESPR